MSAGDIPLWMQRGPQDQPVDVVRLREALADPGPRGPYTTASAVNARLTGEFRMLETPEPAQPKGLGPWTEASVTALLAHLQRLTDAVERVEASQQALHDRLDTLERAWKARGAL